MKETAEKVIIGKIFVGDADDTVVSALAIRDGKIIYSGDKEGVREYLSDDTKITQLDEGQLVIAGFIDGHCHLAPLLAAKKRLFLISEDAAQNSAKKCVEEIADYVKKNPDRSYYIGHNWMPGIFENGVPTADLLDVIPTDKPIVILDNGNHTYWTNSAAMKIAGVTAQTPDPEGGKIEHYPNGEPCGCFKDTAEFLIKKALPDATVEEDIPGLMEGQKMYEAYGYTGFFDALTNEQAAPEKQTLIDAFKLLDSEGKLDVYVQGSFVVNNCPEAFDQAKQGIELCRQDEGSMFKLRTIKLFLDGVVEGETAYLSKPYCDNPDNYGAARWLGEESVSRLREIVAMVNDAGYPCHFHAIGDAAVTTALDCIEYAYKKLGDKVLNVRNVITHLQIVKPEDIPRFKQLGVIANLNPWACKSPGMYNETEAVVLGKERAEKEYPYNSFIKNGVMTAFGTDYGCSFVSDPIECFHALTTRTFNNDDPATLLNPSERINRCDAVRVMTANTAYQLSVENEMGTLEAGKKANLVLLSKDLLTIPDNEIMSTKVLKTMCNGKWVYEA